jgi:hypothetical protein
MLCLQLNHSLVPDKKGLRKELLQMHQFTQMLRLMCVLLMMYSLGKMFLLSILQGLNLNSNATEERKQFVA